ncbi:MAG: PilZ domain-containing protein [Candidatus Omnitrophota bacterium]|jgi:c-di-GMP-binding flagellar brake protein YcgR|nr:MAG: PilZ domain-containing protein [Candidatus Omnitrophota bacterium]
METRITPRVDINITIISTIPADQQQKFALTCGSRFEAHALDISEMGIGIVSKYYLPKKLIIEMEIDGTLFGLKDKMITMGEIRYCAFVRTLGYRCGIKFVDPPEEYRKAIAKFVSLYERRKEPRVRLAD